MKKYLVVASTVLLFACGAEEQVKNDENVMTEEVEVTITKHGADISEEGAITAAEFLSKFDGSQAMEVKLSANISEVCSKKGCWMMLDLGDGKEMRVTFKDYEFFVPKDAAGSLAIVEGVASMDTTSVEELKHYLQDAEASQEEIDAVTEPEYNYAFEAIGVIIKNEKLTTSGAEEAEHHEEEHNHEGHEH
ncbi:MAG: DUF4920 domain-containing protein [Flavobacteriales bacterium]|nr:DUF4920 domain-containing protein [Flavobacteriales bacterium]MCB9335869.1 DUF4920 domain-containing protein [Flavobacteriales bacterium]